MHYFVLVCYLKSPEHFEVCGWNYKMWESSTDVNGFVRPWGERDFRFNIVKIRISAKYSDRKTFVFTPEINSRCLHWWLWSHSIGPWSSPLPQTFRALDYFIYSGKLSFLLLTTSILLAASLAFCRFLSPVICDVITVRANIWTPRLFGYPPSLNPPHAVDPAWPTGLYLAVCTAGLGCHSSPVAG